MEMPIAQHFGFAITDVGPGLFEITAFPQRTLFQPRHLPGRSRRHLSRHGGSLRRCDDVPRGWGASTVDYTIKLIAPAAGEKLVARGRLVRSGRTLSVTAADVYAVRDGNETLCATALATIRNFEARGS